MPGTIATDPEPVHSTKARAEQERVTFESSDDSYPRSRKPDGAASSIQSGDDPVSTSSSWAPHSAMDGASTSITSVHSPRTKTDEKSNSIKNSKSSTNRSNDKGNNHEQSLTERLGNSALASTLEILKLAGGATLTTTGILLSPSLEITKNLILPNLFAGVADYVSQMSPQRLKDWFRIVSASIHHVIAVVVATERGSIFRHKVVRVGGDLVDVVSSDPSRQALMDGMACFVKLSEALHTPEFKSFLEEASVLGCRVVDAVAMDKNKKLIHDFYDLVWSSIELVNDPATTVAFAEVAAYLCHALEMEDAAIHGIVKEREEINRTAARKRRERDQYQTSTYQESYLFQDPNATVEEVILSAFGVIQKSVEEAKLNQCQGENGIPGSVVLASDEGEESERVWRAVTPPPETVMTETKSRGKTKEKDDPKRIPNTPNENALKIDSNDIDVNYLRNKITQRAEATKKEHIQTRASVMSLQPCKLASIGRISTIADGIDDGKKDIEELASLTKEETLKARNGSTLQFEDFPECQSVGSTVPSLNDSPAEAFSSFPDRPDRSRPMEGETPVAHFHRVLNGLLNDQRKEVVASVLRPTGLDSLEATAELASGTLKKHVQSQRFEKRRKSSAVSSAQPAIEKFVKENEILVCGLILGALLLGLVFCAFGFYGIYVFVVPPSTHHFAVTATESDAFTGSGIHLPLVLPDDKQSPHAHEYVIRVVRQVVHVDAKGEILHLETEEN